MPAQIVSYRPKTLFRYRPLRNPKNPDSLAIVKREFAAVRDNYIWASRFDKLNDPMEGQFARGFGVGFDRLDLIMEKAGIGIASFSETATNELMWAHYASEFAGLCLAYDFETLVAALPHDVLISKMRYSHTIPNVEERDFVSRRVAATGVLGVKSQAWLYEREWRLFASNLDEVRYAQGREPVVCAAYLGFRIDPRHRDWLVPRLEELGIMVRAVKVEGYELRTGLVQPPRPVRGRVRLVGGAD